MFLGTRSNYERLLDYRMGTMFSALSADNITSKRTSHKLAEQGRRNRINVALREMLELLPANVAPSHIASGNKTGPEFSKAQTVEAAIKYIKDLKDSVAQLESRAAETVQVSLPDSSYDVSAAEAYNLSRLGEFPTHDKSTEHASHQYQDAADNSVEDPVSYVEQWQASARDSGLPLELGILGRLSQEILKLYKDILRNLVFIKDLSSQDEIRLKRYYDLFVLWADEHAALDGTLDQNLQMSGAIQRATLEHLTSVGRILAESTSQ